MATCTEERFDVKMLRELYQPNQQRIELAKQRQAAFFKHEKTDKAPIILGTELTSRQDMIPNGNFEEEFFNKEAMLCNQIRSALGVANSNSDGVPSIRGNFGCGTICSCLGLEQDVSPDKMPWLKEHLTRDQVAKLTPDDIQVKGTFARGLEFMKFYKEIMGDSIAIYSMDHQGPFDLAHLIMGDDIFLAIYDDPQLVHNLLELCVEMSEKTITMMKEISGEPLTSHYHGNALYAENMGIRICEDTTAIVGPDIINEFAIPYSEKLAQKFGGAWVHYCGRNDHLTDAVCKSPILKAINFGHIPGHEHDQPFETVMEKCLESGTCYVGGWPIRDNESESEYLMRLHEWAAKGVLLAWGVDYKNFKKLNSAEAVLDFWYSL